MNIAEAVREAIETGKCITRESVEGETGKSYRQTRIRPTNSYANCIICTYDMNGEEIHHCRNWNPSAEDLMADDWVLVG